MKTKLIIIGAGGHGKVIADIAVRNGYTDINFIDDNITGTCMGFPIIGTTADLEKLNKKTTEFVIGIGDNCIRKEIAETYNLKWATMIHPSAQIGLNVTIGCGTVIMANAVVNVCSVIGKHCIINTCAIVEHDNVLGNYAHISPKVGLGGTVHIGENTHIGIGAIVRNNIEICGDCVVGAGAVVVEDLTEPTVYIGVPAKKMLEVNKSH